MAKKKLLKTGVGTSIKRENDLKTKAMKRINNLFDRVISMNNLQLAASKAQRGKSNQYGVKEYNLNADGNLIELKKILKEKTFRTSEYYKFKVYEPKERDVFRLPFFPDRIVHHAIMNVLEPIFISTFTRDTYSSIKGRGIHAAARYIKKSLKDVPNSKYCLKLDIEKFYANIDHDILKSLLRKKVKDKDLLWLLDEIIDSAEGIPIGNYLSQFFANFYLTYFDHWIKEMLRVKYYCRYADDIVILCSNKSDLHQIRIAIREYLSVELNLRVKSNYQIFPVESRGIDFVGYVFFHTHILLRKRIKKNFARMLKRNRNNASIASYKGWAKHANSKHLLKKLLYEN